MTIGGMTRVGKRAVVEAACVGAHVEIGEGAVVVRFRSLSGTMYLRPCLFFRSLRRHASTALTPTPPPTTDNSPRAASSRTAAASSQGACCPPTR